jgi:uncharacterized membrane protein
MLLILIIAFSLAFAFSHIVLCSEPLRSQLVEKMGTMGFRVVYSFIAVGTLAPAAVISFTNRHLGPVLFVLPHWAEIGLALILMFVAVQLLVLSLATPSPISLIPAKAEARGILRITRHPMNIGWASFGLAHLLANGALSDVVFFGVCFVLVGLGGAYHMDARKRRRADEQTTAFFKVTSVLPFGAILLRRQHLVLSELAWPMVILGAIVWAALILFHGQFFGAPLF